MKETERIHHNRQRMGILKALNVHVGVGEWVDFEEAIEVLDKMDLPMVPNQLSFHLRFCEGHGWVDLKRGRTEESANAILKVRLTVVGLDRIDIGKMPDPQDTQKFPAREREE